MHRFVDWLASTDPHAQPVDSLRQWKHDRVVAHQRHAARSSFERAVLDGLRAERLGWAFVGGYHNAIHALLEYNGVKIRPEAIICFCASEGSRKPRHFETCVNAENILSGTKSFVTMGTVVEVMIVISRKGNDLKAVLIDTELLNTLQSDHLEQSKKVMEAGKGSVVLEGARKIPFIPEIPHGKVTLENVPVSKWGKAGYAWLLPNDGYDNWYKLFRTVEDLHVMSSLMGYLLGASRRHNWPMKLQQELVHILCTLWQSSEMDPKRPETHVVLAGALACVEGLIRGESRAGRLLQTSWETCADVEERARWTRDVSVFNVASQRRRLRSERAWERLFVASAL